MTQGSGSPPTVRVEELASHLGARGSRFEAGLTPSKLGWGSDDEAHPIRFVVDPVDLAEMVWVPAGRFRMGSTREEIGRLWRENGWAVDRKRYAKAEQPAHEVTISRGYWLHKHPLTSGQYDGFLAATGHAPPPWWDEHEAHGRLPVVNVTWDDCVAYATWAGGSLPTEAQWEYGARGPEGRLFPWGDVWDRTKCVCAEYHAQRALNGFASWEAWYLSIGATRNERGGYSSPPGTSTRHLRPVGQFPQGASWCGALDMAGNVWEWCADWYDRKAYKRYARGDLTPPSSGQYRVLRGGAWDSSAYGSHLTSRNYIDPARRNFNCGFRVARAF